MLVSHDRAFIQRTCREMVELEGGRFVRYPFRYDSYVVERAARLERARAEYERQKEHVDKTEDFIRRNIAGQKTKQAQSRRKMLEKLDRLERPEDHWELAGQIALRFSTGGELGSQGDHPRARADASATRASPSCATSRVQHLPRRPRRHRGPERLRQVDAAQDPGGRAAAAGAARSSAAAACASATSIRSWARWTKTRSLIDEIRSVRADLSPEAVRQYLAKFRFFGDDAFRAVRELVGRRAQPAGAGQDDAVPAQRAGAGRADQPPRHPRARGAGRGADEATRARSSWSATTATSWIGFARGCSCSRTTRSSRTWATTRIGGRGALPRRRRPARRRSRWVERRFSPAPAPVAPTPTSVAPRVARPPAQSTNAQARLTRERQRLERRVASLREETERLTSEVEVVRAELSGDHGGNWHKAARAGGSGSAAWASCWRGGRATSTRRRRRWRVCPLGRSG